MDKIAILVIGAKAPKILGRVLDFFDDPRFRFFLHVDAKIDLQDYRRELRHADRVTFIEPRIAVFWGGFSMIETEFALLRAALADAEISGMVLWSDDTVPLRGPDEIYQALTETPDRISGEVRNYVQEWYSKFYFGDSHFTSFIKHLESRAFQDADWDNMQRLQRARERGKKPLEKVHFSRQWWALGRASAVKIMDYLAADEHLLESFRYSLFADEIMFATVYKLCFPVSNGPDVPMYADYDRPPVPYIYTKPGELPDLKKVPAHCLFVRKIWPWSVDLVDILAKRWPALATPPAALPAKPAAAPAAAVPAEAYQAVLAAAVEAREDGELEESAALLEGALQDHPGVPELTLAYVATLRKQKRPADADKILDTAIARHPDHFELRRVWADVPCSTLDHDEVIRRGKIFRAAFPPAEYPNGWHSLAMVYGSMSESLRWDEIRDSIVALQDGATKNGKAFRIALWQATELCMTGQIKTMVEAARPDAWNQLPQEAKGNARLRADMAVLNGKLVAVADVRVVALGQNCLPFLLGGRWGLIADRARPEATTPFDRGAFQKNNAALVIDNDFATFSDRAEFAEAGVYDGSKMYRHEATGIYFYHERGPYWLKNDGARFFPHLERMLATWRSVSTVGRRLFVFCLCGEGELAPLVEVMDRRLLGPDAHLLIVDVLRQPHECPEHPRVTYLHAPYPADYIWDEFNHQTAARGIGFELGVVIPIMDHLLSYLPETDAAWYREQRRHLLRESAAGAAGWRRDHDNSVFLYAALCRVEPDNMRNEIAYARALRDNGRAEESQKVLARTRERHPGVYEVHAAWADVGVAPFDWMERLIRLRSLREAYPPEREPRSWQILSQELDTLMEHGQWVEAAAFIEAQWPALTTRADLYRHAVSAAIQLGDLVLTRRLLAQATEEARAVFSAETLEGVQNRLDAAEANQALLLACRARIIPLGQNGMPTMMMARWGLNAALRAFNDSTPFELGDFYGDTTADAIADDFQALSRRDAYIGKPAWGGGMTLRHVPSDVAFLVHRNAQLGPVEQQRFFTHLDAMVRHWRRIKNVGRRVFVYFQTYSNNAERLVEVLKEELLDANARLVIVALTAEPPRIASGGQITVLHAPLPERHQWFNAFGSAGAEAINYERRLLAPILTILEEFAGTDAPERLPAHA